MSSLRLVRKFRRCIFTSIVLLQFALLSSSITEAKPTNKEFKSSLTSSPSISPPIYVGRSQDSKTGGSSSSSGSDRKVLTSTKEDGTWQASARLPTSSQSGGNENSRYKIRRDGSLSLSLQIPKSHITSGRASKSVHLGSNENANGKSLDKLRGNSRQFSPSELKSFSVVISDVDVTGNYNKNLHGLHVDEDAYSKAGVSSYHLKSNSIHRMNASWKLKPGHLTPSSDDLLEFLSYFANVGSDVRATRSDIEISHQDQIPQSLKRKILGQRKDEDDHEQQDEKINNQPFLTWSQSSRNIPLTSSTELNETFRSPAINDDDGDATTKKFEHSSSNASSTPSTSNEAKVVLHELLSSLDELNESVDAAEKSEAVTLSDPNVKKARNNTHDKEEDESSQLQSQTELDQARKSTEEGVHLVDEEMTESWLHKKGEKEGELFVGNDEAEIFDSNESNTTHNTNTSSSSSKLTPISADNAEERKGRNAKSAFFNSTTNSTNRNDHEDDDENEEYGNNKFNTNSLGRSTSATSLLLERGANNKRMKIADPQQTASDLKKLMALILKSEGTKNHFTGMNTGSIMGEGDKKNGAQVVNIVITPNQETFLTPSHLQISSQNHQPQMKVNGPQKIMFLKTPQVKQMLDIALTDPALSSAAHKIAAALEANPYSNPIDHNYDPLPDHVAQHELNKEDNGPSTPNGFPLSGNGYLNMNHPNLQFHQALHHMISNGSTPTTINATTKTNIINIFVINFKENTNNGGNSAEDTGVLQHQLSANQSPFRIKIRPSQRPTVPLPISMNPLLIQSVSTTPTSDLTSLHFNNKMGLAAPTTAHDSEDDEADAEPSKNFDMAHHILSTPPDKINIFDLLPGDIGAVTAVQYAPGVEKEILNLTFQNNDPSSTTMKYGDYFADFLPDRSREPPGNQSFNQAQHHLHEHDILSILTANRHKKPTSLESESSSMGEEEDALPPALAHLQWIFKNQPPKPQVSPQMFLKRKGQVESDKSTEMLENGSNVSSDSMMEPEETSNSPLKYQGASTQELVEFLMKLQNVSRPLATFDLKDLNRRKVNTSVENFSKNETFDNRNIKNFTDIVSIDESSEDIVHYTTKRPAFWKFGNKLPVGSFNNNNNDEALNNRLRKLLTAFGYSALPTIAAGAAATWPFWVPLVATGRRRKRSSPFKSITQEDSEIRGQSFLTNAMIKTNKTSNYGVTMEKNATEQQQSSPSSSLSNRQLLSKSTKNSRREGNSNLDGEKKWIKVDVITASTPYSSTSAYMNDHNSHEAKDELRTSFHGHSSGQSRDKNRNGDDRLANNTQNYNLRPQQKHRHDEKQHLDLPLIKDFLKNVLYNEFNLPTKAPTLTTPKPLRNNNFKRPLLSPPPTQPVALNPYSIFTPYDKNNFNKLVTKNNHPDLISGATHHSQNNNRNASSSFTKPFSRPSTTPSLNLTPEYPEMIAGSDKKHIYFSHLTSSPTSVHIHNWGDGTSAGTSSATTQIPTHFSTSTSLAHWLNGNTKKNPWGSSFNEGDKIGTSISTTFTNTAAALSGHNNNMNPHPNHNSHNINYSSNHFHQQTNEVLQKTKLADSIRTAESTTTTKTDMTNNGQRTIDNDSTQQQRHHHNERSTKRNANFPPVRSQRRLHKWTNDKTDELNAAAEENDELGDTDENGPLVQSLSAMASHLMNPKNGVQADDDEDDDDDTENLENSSERDVYITEKGHGVTVPNNDENDTEETASEEDSTDQADNYKRKHGTDINDVGGEEEDEDGRGSDQMSPKLKSDHYSTTPKGLTTWSDVNGPSQMPMYSSKVTVQKIPLEYTISSVLSFSTERPQTTQEMVVIKERVTTTEPSTNKITTKVNLLSPSSISPGLKNKRRPSHKYNKKVAPTKFVKPQLEEVTAEVTSIGDTHVVYKTKVTTEAPEPKSTGVTDFYERFTTKKPIWPYQMTTRRSPTKRPAFTRITAKPKNPYQNKRPQVLSMTNPTTTTPASTTTYMRNPQPAFVSPITGLTLSLADIPFMDYIRSQIIPRIGLTLISFMASTPILFSLLGAAGLRRRKRSISSSQFSSFNGRALFESLPNQRAHNDQFDFSTVQKKFEDAFMKQPARRKIVGGNGNDGSPSKNYDLITEAFRHLARWWATKSAPPKSRSVNKGNESKQQNRDI